MNLKTKNLNEIIEQSFVENSLIQLYIRSKIHGVPVFQYWSDSNNDVFIDYPKIGDYVRRIINADGEFEKELTL